MSVFTLKLVCFQNFVCSSAVGKFAKLVFTTYSDPIPRNHTAFVVHSSQIRL